MVAEQNIIGYSKYADLVVARQIEITYKQISKISIINIIAAFILLGIMWEHSDKLYATIWISLMLITGGVFTPVVIYVYNKIPEENRYTSSCGKTITLLALFRGMAWGSSAWLLFPDQSPYHQIVLIAFLTGTISIASMVSAAYRPAFFAFTITMVSPFIVRLALSPAADHQIFALCICLYLILLIYINRPISSSITQALYLQYALVEQKKAAESAKRVQTQFLATASHDLRQPLHAHGLLVSTLKNRITDPESNRILEVLESSMNSMQSLLNSILDISKLDAGALVPEIHTFNIHQLLDQLFLDFETQANSQNIKFAVRSVDAIVQSDRALLERILRNLIGNAINYTERGAVLVTGRKRKGMLRIEVRDSGPGIDPSDQNIIFQEFRQLTLNRNNEYSGLGLGLAIVRRLAGLLHHKIELKSAINCGSTFSIEVPISTEQIKIIKPELEEREKVGLIGIKSLIVDDDPTIRLGMQHILKAWGSTVTTCSSSNEVIALLDNDNYLPDIAIVDYRLTEETGIELINKMNTRLKSSVPTIIITGDTAVEKLHDFQHSGHLVLHKPVAPEKLYNAIVSLLTKQDT